jgi:hypothetical protein
VGKEGGKKEEKKEMHHRQEMIEREAEPTERGRGRGLAGTRQMGRMPSGRGNTPLYSIDLEY